MDRRVKERLLGAAILVAAIVLIAPELLSGPKPAPKPAAGLPSLAAAAPVRSYTVDVAENGSTAAPVESPAAARAATAAAGARPGGDEDRGASPVAGGAAAAPATGASTRLADPTEIKRPAPRVLEAARSAPTDEGAGRHGWSVQLGSFANEANARKLVHELYAKGFTAYVLSSGAGKSMRHRVRVGPWADEGAALQAAAKLKAHGHAGSVVPPPSA